MHSYLGRFLLAAALVVALCAPGPAAAQTIGPGTITYQSRPFSCPADPTPTVNGSVNPASPYNYQTIFSSLPTGVAGYGSANLTSIVGTSNQTLIAGGSYVNLAEQYTATFDITQAGYYDFRAGGDETYGAILTLSSARTVAGINYVTTDILQERFPSTQCGDDAAMFWDYNFNDPSQYLDGSEELTPNIYTLTWTGFDSCCDGSAELEYSVGDDFDFIDLSVSNITEAVPEPASWPVLSCAFAMLLAVRVCGRTSSRSSTSEADWQRPETQTPVQWMILRTITRT